MANRFSNICTPRDPISLQTMKRYIKSTLLLWTACLLCFALVHAQEDTYREYNPQYHTVQRGETLYSIARKYNISIDWLKSQNGLRSNEIFPNQHLLVSPQDHTVNDYQDNSRRQSTPQSESRNQSIPVQPDLPISSKPVAPSYNNQGYNRSGPSLETRMASVLRKQERRTFQRVHNSFHHINSPQRQRSFYLNLQQLMDVVQSRDLIFIVLSGNLSVLREDVFNYISDLPGTKMLVIDYALGDMSVRSRVQSMRYDRSVIVVGSDYVDRRRLNNSWYAQVLKQAISEGLEGAADMNQDRSVQLHELDFFINERVNELSRGMQKAFIQASRQASGITFYLD